MAEKIFLTVILEVILLKNFSPEKNSPPPPFGENKKKNWEKYGKIGKNMEKLEIKYGKIGKNMEKLQKYGTVVILDRK